MDTQREGAAQKPCQTNEGRESTGKVTRILLVEDETLLRSLLRGLLEREGQFLVVGEAANVEQALGIAATADPDVILLDLRLGEECTVNIVPRLIAEAPNASVILVTGSDDAELLQAAVQAGARGIVLKGSGIDTLMKAISKVSGGEMWLDRMFTTRFIEDITQRGGQRGKNSDRAKIAGLTGREREIATLVCRGMNNKEIAERLFIAEITVRHHLTSVFAKLGVADRVSLVIFGYRSGLAVCGGKGGST